MAGGQYGGDHRGSTLYLLQSLLTQTLGPSAPKPRKQALQRWAFDILLGYGKEELPDVQEEERIYFNEATLVKACFQSGKTRGGVAEHIVELANQLRRRSTVLSPSEDDLHGSVCPSVTRLTEHEPLLSLLLSLAGAVAKPKPQGVPLISPLPMYSLAPDASLEPPTPPSIDQPRDRSKLLSEEVTPRTALLGQPPSADLRILEHLWPADQDSPNVPSGQDIPGDARQVDAMMQRMSRRPVWQPSSPGRVLQGGMQDDFLAEQLQMLMIEEEPSYSTVFYSTPEYEQPDILRQSAEKARSSRSSLISPRQQDARAKENTQSSSQGHLNALNVEPIIANEVLLALQGIQAAVQRLQQLQQCGLGKGSIARLLSRLSTAGQLRANLDAFRAAYSISAQDRSVADPARQALVGEIQRILQEHDLALQNVPSAALARRQEDLAGQGGSSPAAMTGGIRLTVLEVVAHTSRIQEELQILAYICWCQPVHNPSNDGAVQVRWQLEAFPRRAALLDHLYRSLGLSFIDTAAAKLLQRLFLASLRPFAAQLCTSLHQGLEVADVDIPAFLQESGTELKRAGEQLSVLRNLGTLTQPLLRHIALSLAAEEAALAAIVGMSTGKGMLFEPYPSAGLLVTFSATRLQQVAALHHKAAAERAVEVGRILDNLALQSTMPERAQEAHTEPGSDAFLLSEPAGSSAVTAVTATQPAAQLVDYQIAPMPGLEAGVSSLAALLQADHELSRRLSGPEPQASEALAMQISQPCASARAGVNEEEHTATSQSRANGLGSVAVTSLNESKLLWGDLGGQALSGMPAAEADRIPAPAAAAEDGVVSDDAPVAVVVDECLVQPIRAHYLCVSGICLRLFRERVQLKELLEALQRYFFLAAGDFGHNLCAELCAHAASRRSLRERDLQDMLEDSIKASSMEADTYAARLRGRLRGQSMPEDSVMLGEQTLGGFDVVELNMEVPWPLSLVVTQGSMEIYSEVFSSLLQFQRVGYVANTLWSTLAIREPSRPLDQGASSAEVQCRLRRAQLMRFQAGQFAAVLQSFIQEQILGAPWATLLAYLQHGARDLVDLRESLQAYLAECRAACLLTAETAHLRQRTMAALQAVLDFREQLLGPRDGSCDVAAMLQDDGVWHALQGPMQAFSNEVKALHAMLKAEPPHSPFAALFTQLDMSGFYGPLQIQEKQA